MGVPRKLTLQELKEMKAATNKDNYEKLFNLVSEVMIYKMEWLEANMKKILNVLNEEPVTPEDTDPKKNDLERTLCKLIAEVTQKKCADVEDFLELNEGGFMTFRKLCLKEIVVVKRFFGLGVLEAKDYASAVIISEYALSYLNEPSFGLIKLDKVFRLAESLMTY